MTRIVNVVAAALIDPRGHVLVAQRPEGKSLAGLWEFPGGKIEPGETPEAALVRELAEELDIAVAADALLPLTFVSHGYADFHLLMLLYVCRSWSGEPSGLQGQPLRWDSPAALEALPMPPADIPLLATLKAFVAAA
jgi:8-oxo-dGTP diphosphatase